MKKIILSALALVALASCSKNQESTFVVTDSEVRISSTISTRTSGNNWEKNDSIGVYMTTYESASFADLGTNVLYTTADADGSFDFVATTAAPMQLYYPATDNVDFLAYYPYSENTTATGVYQVNVLDQDDQGAIDLMLVKVTNQIKTDQEVKMIFDHKLARIALTIQPGGGLVDTDLEGITVTLSGTDTEATYGLTIADDASPITLGVEVDDIVMKTADNGQSAEAIIIPQSVSATLTFNTTDGNTFTATIPTTTFAIGLEYLYTVTIRNTEVSISSATISGWGDALKDADTTETGITADPFVQ